MPEGKEGSVLVIGGGIAGIQASLDLAEAGFYVYLVEEASAIGGKMAQLDKTFPTNDCSMCMLSPKLVEAGRHHNIKILTDTEVLGLEGEVGHFTAKLRRKPRYIDVEKCIGCGDCAKVCPIMLSSGFDGGLGTRRAAYRLYPQAIPAAYAIEKKGIAPCKNACPVETSAQGYIALIAQRRYAEALEVIKQYNPFPASVGRVCHHPCEAACNRGKVDESIAICALKRFVADHQAGKPVVPLERKYPEEVAVVGSGPAGLSCAHHLARLGYKVTVFEALPVAGGMMRVGIPAYRLPREILEREIEDIRKEGVEIRLNSPIRDINELLRRGYKAIFLAVGAHEPQELGIPNERGPGVLYGVAFLRQVSLGQKVELGEKVLVVGGGNTAVDCARTALRLGAKEVTLVYRRTRAEMPAFPQEVKSAEAEGVKLEFLAAPLEVLRENGHLRGARCIRMRLAEPDASGRRRPVPIEGSEFVVEADTMIAAVAQAPEISLLHPDHGLEISGEGTFVVDSETLATNRPGIFAGGDAAQGPGMLIEAIAAGRRGALSIHRYLRGLPLRTAKETQPLPVAELTEGELQAQLATGQIQRQARSAALTRPALERIGDFKEVELGLNEEQAVEEAKRCLACGICAECYQCVKACQANAIDHEMVEKMEEIEVGAVVLAPGYETYDAKISKEFGFGRYANVLTSLQFERILSASGPTNGHIQRPSDGKEPRKIAFIQCVGSRDLRASAPFCSSVCCMYTTKQAIIAKEHAQKIQPTIFYIDMRAFGKDFDNYIERAKSEYGIRYVRCMPSQIAELPESKNLSVRYEDEQGSFRDEEFDLVVLSVGLRPNSKGIELAQRLGIKLNEYGFAKSSSLNPLESSREGIFVAGAFCGPKDIPETVIEASAAAAAVGERLAEARFSKTKEKEYPAELALNEGPRIGVFVCHCGSNIASVVDVKSVAQYAAKLPNVVFSEDVLYACSQDSLKHMREMIKEHNLNRVVVASCTPRTHEPLFQDTIRESALNKFLFEMVDIREQCSWVHADSLQATEKAKALVRMGVAKARGLQPLSTRKIPIIPKALVIGGGLSGMTAALSLAKGGFMTYLLERSKELGGNLRHIFKTIEGDDVQTFLNDLIKKVERNPNIQIYTEAEISEFSGFVGNFSTKIKTAQGEERIEHGVIVVATGGDEYKPKEYLYGEDDRVMTQRELEKALYQAPQKLKDKGCIVMIQCVGSRNKERPYCSRICCAQAIKNALATLESDPKRRVYVLYRDIRTYGFLEDYYRRAREKGARFIRYEEDSPPQVHKSESDEKIIVTVKDERIKKDISIAPDLLVLSVGIVPDAGNEGLSKRLKVPIDSNGFFCEAHVKLRPVDFASHGIFLCGLGHAPNLIPEIIVKAKAAAGRAATLLSQKHLEAGGIVALVDPTKCVACLTCVRECPYGATFINKNGVAEVDAARCQGCGICAADCPAKAIQLQQFEDAQEIAMLEELFAATGDSV